MLVVIKLRQMMVSPGGDGGLKYDHIKNKEY